MKEEKKAADPTYNILHDEEHGAELRRLLGAIQDNKSKHLFRWANRFGIEVYRELPDDARDSLGQLAWWNESETEIFICRSRFSYRGAARLNKLIKEKRYEVAKKWTDLLAPMLSTIISILAFLIAILALYLQASSDPIIILPPQN